MLLLLKKKEKMNLIIEQIWQDSKDFLENITYEEVSESISTEHKFGLIKKDTLEKLKLYIEFSNLFIKELDTLNVQECDYFDFEIIEKTGIVNQIKRLYKNIKKFEKELMYGNAD